MRTETNYLKGKIIAEFMGIDQVDIDTYQETNSNLKYHTSWDWLMPVVEKIESLGYELIIAESRCKINHNTDHSIEEVINIEIIGSKIDVTYRAVVEFINQLNKQTK